eukprot:TRINITY_DN61511_c0_g1_i1.p1 TRINITY_DN61511_c0_g1~~TRINITY_DN61511_c0_g1_i1.p1  ORF type:complete len:302 (+),score=35.90 TRINITY_DN61511_c0_g1_i1:60-908(+)
MTDVAEDSIRAEAASPEVSAVTSALLQISVHMLSGDMISQMDVQSSDSVLNLKYSLEQATTIPSGNFRLIVASTGYVLREPETLGDAGVVNGSQITFMRLPPHIHVDAGSGDTFLNLVGQNYSSSFKWKSGVTATTRWKKIRFDTDTLMVHTGDFRYAEVDVTKPGAGRGEVSADGLLQGPPGLYTPFATCLDCSAPHSHKARGRIDLTQTPYKVPPGAFKHAGYLSAGTWKYSEDDQVVDLTGGGYCGWTAPLEAVDKSEVDEKCGGWWLQLESVTEASDV